MLRTILIGIALVGTGSFQVAEAQSLSPVPSHPSAQRAVLDRYCVVCHNQQLVTAGLALDTMDVEQISEGAAVWEKVLRKLQGRAMPPAGMPRPDEATYDSLTTYLEQELDSAESNPGRPVLHRLNRAEYTNVIRDLLALEIDGTTLLPADDSGYGFDNIGDVLSVSPMLLERYMSAARKISRLAIGDHTGRPDSETHVVPRFLGQQDRTSDELPFGSRGGIAVRHFFPLDGDYLFKVRLKTSYDGSRILGLAEPHQLDIHLDRQRVGHFTVGGTDRVPLGYRTSPVGEAAPDAHLEVRLPVAAGPHLVGVSFLKEAWAREQMIQPTFASTESEEPGVGSVTISGPYNARGPGETPSRNRIFVCRPTSSQDQEPCARNIISTLARHAYRRPIADQELPSLLAPYHIGREEGGFEEGIELALQRILVSPEFLFRIEQDPENVEPGTAYPIRDLELASRLSFFLWSSIPDDTLLDLAAEGRLKDPAVLEEQVRRMLADPRSESLVTNFAGQWLYLRNIAMVAPDLGEFPEFDENLREGLQRETELFFGSMLREDRSVADLLDADYTFLNERLARHYGIANIYGSHFRRVTLDHEERKGLLGKGSILTATSYANRTSPVLRGKWILENILGTPPPPPPPNVPELPEPAGDGQPLTMRERMEAHRANPACATCHARMDPLGFALENFDAIGGWRSTEAGSPIDSSGVLPDGTQFEGASGLRKVLLGRREAFVMNVTEKLLTYALGRGVEYYDAPAVRSVMRQAAPSDYRWSSLITGIIKSTPFRMRRSAEQ
jgi:cytochrome c5